MHVFLFLCSVVSFLLGVLYVGGAKTALHEIQGHILFLTAAVCMAGAAATEAVHRVRKTIESQKG